MFCFGSAVDDGQIAAGYNLEYASCRVRISIPQDMTIQIEGNRTADGEGAANVDVLRQPDNVHRIIRQSALQRGRIIDGEVLPAREGDVLRHSRAEVPLRAIGLVPAVKEVARFGGIGRLGCRIAAIQKLRDVVRAVDLIRHGNTVDVVIATTGELAVEDGALGHTLIHRDRYCPISIQIAPDNAAVGVDSKVRQVHIRLNIRISTNNHSASGITLRVYRLQHSTVIRNDRAVQDKRGAAVVIYRSALRGSTVSDCAAVHGELPRVVDTASFQGPRTIPDCTAVHDECAVFSDIHAAAASALGGAADDGGVAIHLKYAASVHFHTAAFRTGAAAAHDVAAVHGQPAAVAHLHTATAVYVVATGDSAAEDGFVIVAALIIPIPNTVTVAIVDPEFMLLRGSAVGDDHVTAIFNFKYAAAAALQYITVEIEGDFAGNGQSYTTTQRNVRIQLDNVHGGICKRGNKLLLRADTRRLRNDARCIC